LLPTRRKAALSVIGQALVGLTSARKIATVKAREKARVRVREKARAKGEIAMTTKAQGNVAVVLQIIPDDPTTRRSKGPPGQAEVMILVRRQTDLMNLTAATVRVEIPAMVTAIEIIIVT